MGVWTKSGLWASTLIPMNGEEYACGWVSVLVWVWVQGYMVVCMCGRMGVRVGVWAFGRVGLWCLCLCVLQYVRVCLVVRVSGDGGDYYLKFVCKDEPNPPLDLIRRSSLS